MSDTPESTSSPTTTAPAKPAQQENALANLLMNILLPVTILSYLSKEGKWYSLGPTWALVVAVLLPVSYQIWDWRQRRQMNIFSIIGLVSVLLTGGLGLLKLNPVAFALKEASIPLVLGIVFIITHKMGKPLSKALLLNPDMIDKPKLDRVVREKNAASDLEKLLWQGTLILAASFFISAVMNYFLAMHFLQGTTPGTEAYTAAIGKQTGWGFLVIGLPMMLFLVWAFMLTMKGLKRITGLEMKDLMLR
jgi:intracellular septation protein A